jgi:hypothetical protein
MGVKRFAHTKPQSRKGGGSNVEALRQLFVGGGLVGFFFSPSLQKAPLNLQAARVLTIWPQMVSHMTTANGVFELPASGKKFRSIGR